MHECMHVCAYIHTYIYIYMYRGVWGAYIYIYTYIHTYIHAHTHTGALKRFVMMDNFLDETRKDWGLLASTPTPQSMSNNSLL